MIADVAFTFGCYPGALMDEDFDELMAWHRQATRINKQLQKG
ncbi:MAG: GpE family phage tail protein [Rubrivivax sp.]|nr:GpE family phage tail protein [Rubrivivax sp.]